MQSLASTSTCEHRHRTWLAVHPPSCHNTPPPRPYPLLTPTNSVAHHHNPRAACHNCDVLTGKPFSFTKLSSHFSFFLPFSFLFD